MRLLRLFCELALATALLGDVIDGSPIYFGRGTIAGARTIVAPIPGHYHNDEIPDTWEHVGVHPPTVPHGPFQAEIPPSAQLLAWYHHPQLQAVEPTLPMRVLGWGKKAFWLTLPWALTGAGLKLVLGGDSNKKKDQGRY